MAEAPIVSRDATLSPCGLYRYTLARRWASGPHVLWVMLNPSTADALDDGPTIRKCVGFARRWSYGGIVVVNLFAYRSTDPAGLHIADDPVGPENDRHIVEQAKHAQAIVAGWGAKDSTAVTARASRVMELLSGRQVHALRLTKKGRPEHPLYVPYDVQAVRVGADAWRRP